jgi:outer membrane lipoprotein-sorting protein
MKKLMFITLFAFAHLLAFAQKPLGEAKSGNADKSDPQAVSILSKVNKKYATFASMQLDLKLTIEDGKYKEEQKGKVFVKANKFKIDSKDQLIISDGKTNWVYLKNDNELQISDPDPDDVALFSSPDKLIKSFEKDFISGYAGEEALKGKTVYVIEFKPKDRNSEYSKVRVKIDKTSLEIQNIKVFDKSNIHYTIDIEKFVKNPPLNESIFKFDESKVPEENIVRLNDTKKGGKKN